MNILSTAGTENTCTAARLEALFKSSQSSPFVPSKIRSPSFLASDGVLNPFRCFVKRSAVLCFVSSSRFVFCLSIVQVLCNLTSVVLELLRLGDLCSTRSFLVHVILMMCFNMYLFVSFSFVRMFLTAKHYFSEPFLVSIFALFVSFSTECFADSWSFRSISDCAPISMFVSIHSTSSLRERGFDARHLCNK